MHAPQPIETAPREEERTLLLYCPEQGGWHTGQWWERAWRDAASLSEVLAPTHWTDPPPAPGLHEAVHGGEFERDLAFVVRYALAYSKNWPGCAKAPPLDDVAGLAGDVIKQLRKSNYRIQQGPPSQVGAWPPKTNGRS